MAILVRGKTKCSLCGEVIKAGEGVVSFPAFIPNPRRCSLGLLSHPEPVGVRPLVPRAL